jgi:hypothetical protein
MVSSCEDTVGAPFAVLKKVDGGMFEAKVGETPAPVLQKGAVLEYLGSPGRNPPGGDDTVLVRDFRGRLLRCFGFFCNCEAPSISAEEGPGKKLGLLTRRA